MKYILITLSLFLFSVNNTSAQFGKTGNDLLKKGTEVATKKGEEEGKKAKEKGKDYAKKQATKVVGKDAANLAVETADGFIDKGADVAKEKTIGKIKGNNGKGNGNATITTATTTATTATTTAADVGSGVVTKGNKGGKGLGNDNNPSTTNTSSDKMKKGKGNGATESNLVGKDFGQARAVEAKTKNVEKKAAVNTSINKGENTVKKSKDKIAVAKDKNENDFKSKAITEEEYNAQKGKIEMIEQKTKALESKISTGKTKVAPKSE